MTNHWLSVIVFAPLAGALINWLVGRRVRSERFIGVVACGSVAVSAGVAFFIAVAGAGGAGLGGGAGTPREREPWGLVLGRRFPAGLRLSMGQVFGDLSLLRKL